MTYRSFWHRGLILSCTLCGLEMTEFYVTTAGGRHWVHSLIPTFGEGKKCWRPDAAVSVYLTRAMNRDRRFTSIFRGAQHPAGPRTRRISTSTAARPVHGVFTPREARRPPVVTTPGTDVDHTSRKQHRLPEVLPTQNTDHAHIYEHWADPIEKTRFAANIADGLRKLGIPFPPQRREGWLSDADVWQIIFSLGSRLMSTQGPPSALTAKATLDAVQCPYTSAVVMAVLEIPTCAPAWPLTLGVLDWLVRLVLRANLSAAPLAASETIKDVADYHKQVEYQAFLALVNGGGRHAADKCLNEGLAGLSKFANQREAEAENLRQGLETLTEQERLKGELASLQSESLSKHQRIETMQAQLSGLQEAAAEAEEQYESLRDEYSAIEAKSGKAGLSMEALTDLIDQKRRYRRDLRRLKPECFALKTQFESEHLRVLQSRYATISSTLLALNSGGVPSHLRLEFDGNPLNRLGEDLEMLLGQRHISLLLSSWEEAVAQLRNNVLESQERQTVDREQLERSNGELQSLRTELDSLTTANQSLAQELDGTARKLSQDEAALSELRERTLNRLSDRQKQLEDQIQRLQESAAVCESEIRAYDARVHMEISPRRTEAAANRELHRLVYEQLSRKIGDLAEVGNGLANIVSSARTKREQLAVADPNVIEEDLPIDIEAVARHEAAELAAKHEAKLQQLARQNYAEI